MKEGGRGSFPLFGITGTLALWFSLTQIKGALVSSPVPITPPGSGRASAGSGCRGRAAAGLGRADHIALPQRTSPLPWPRAKESLGFPQVLPPASYPPALFSFASNRHSHESADYLRGRPSSA